MIDTLGISGLTSNPTIFGDAITGSTVYDGRIRECSQSGMSTTEVYWTLVREDIALACELFMPGWSRSAGIDGYVSVEVDPTLAHDEAKTIREALKLRSDISWPNVMVKIPATDAGVRAFETLVSMGVSTNVTLIFSLARHSQVMDAYLTGLERFEDAGGDLATVASVASFFISRVDVEADRRLKDARLDELSGLLAMANAKLAYQNFLDVISSQRWLHLEELGALPQRCLWASTAVKDPELSDVTYVEGLIGPQTVSTIPLATLRAFADHGHSAPTLVADIDEAKRATERFAAAGLGLAEICALLESQGVEKFRKSYEAALGSIEQKLLG